jgi:hypothetical protein
MANQITKIVVRNGTDSERRTANLTGVTFTLGEPGYCYDTQRLYIGNGVAGGVPVGIRNLGNVTNLFGSYLNTGFSQEAYIVLTSKGAEAGDILFEQSTKTIWSLSARSNFTNSVPLTSDFVRYDTPTLINDTQFFYDNASRLNLIDQGISVTNLNSNVADGITLVKPDINSPISIAPGTISNGVANTNFKFIGANSLYLNVRDNDASPEVVSVSPGQVIGRSASSTLTACNINSVLYSANWSPGPGLVITPYTNTTSILFDMSYLACGTRFFINRSTTINGDLSCTGDFAFDANLFLGGDSTFLGTIFMPNATAPADGLILGGDAALYRSTTETVRTDNSLSVGADLTVDRNMLVAGNATLGNASTDITTLRGYVRVADSPMLFGTGDASYDTNLYRSAANTLKTDDSLIVETNLTVNGDTALGSASNDTTVIRGDVKIADSSSTALIFGVNNASYDTNLYRLTTSTLKTDGSFVTQGNLQVNGEATLGSGSAAVNIVRGTLYLYEGTGASKAIQFGDNAGGYDSNLYRISSGSLRTNSSLTVDGGLTVGGSTITLGNANTDETTLRGFVKIADSAQNRAILFGTGDASYDTNLYRSAPGVLKTDNDFVIGNNLTVQGTLSTAAGKDLNVGGDLTVVNNTTLGDANTDTTILRGFVKIADSAQNRALVFGSGNASYDTNLYRSTTSTLRTDGTLSVNSYLLLGNEDTNLYRQSANVLRTDDNLSVGGVLYFDNNDTNLYRSTANTLKTDNNLIVSGDLSVTGAINSTSAGVFKNMATFASQRISAGTIPLFRATYDMQLLSAPVVTATGGTPTFSPTLSNGTTIAAGTLVSMTAGSVLTNVCISFGYKYT